MLEGGVVFKAFDYCVHGDGFVWGYVGVFGETHAHAERSVLVDVVVYRYVWCELEAVCFLPE